uniref:Uncharacterized protein n=1 Tax=Oryza punctata TaxID=4537 RepID=A0A0E0L534_ORYPU
MAFLEQLITHSEKWTVIASNYVLCLSMDLVYLLYRNNDFLNCTGNRIEQHFYLVCRQDRRLARLRSPGGGLMEGRKRRINGGARDPDGAAVSVDGGQGLRDARAIRALMQLCWGWYCIASTPRSGSEEHAPRKKY